MIDQSLRAADAAVALRDECREIPFEIWSPSGQTTQNVPISHGFSVPSGQLREAGEWIVEGLNGAHYPVQTEVLNRWSDGSVRWLLAHFVAARLPAGRTVCTLVRPRKRPNHACGSGSMKWTDNSVTVRIQNRSAASDESVIRLTPSLKLHNGEQADLKVTEVAQESSGEVRSVLRISVHVAEAPFVNLQFRVELWPTAGLTRVETRIRNSRRARHQGGLWDLGDEGSFFFKELSLAVSSDFTNAVCRWKAEVGSTVRHQAITEGLEIRQHGSGAAAWASRNRPDEDRPVVSQRGYTVSSDVGFLSGHRASPVVSLTSEEATLTVAVPEFWQQFPSSFASRQNEIVVGLFPPLVDVGRPTPHSSFRSETLRCRSEQMRIRRAEVTLPDFNGKHEIQGGEQKTLTACISVKQDESLTALDWAYETPRVIPSRHWVGSCNVIPWLPDELPQSGCEGRFTSYLAHAMAGDYSVDARRDRADEYGWRNFGDVHADHEQTHYAGSNTIDSHYNNQFDLIFGGIQNLITSGDAKWFDLFDSLARHVMDIDIYHTDEDRACFNGGLFWHTDHYVDAKTSTHRTYSQLNANGGSYGGGPSNEHNYTTGLLYYYFLTGQPEARASVIKLANWVINMDDGSRTVFGLFDSGDTGLASQTVFEDFHGPGRGAGNSINALIDAWILTRDDKYLSKAEQLIRRVVHPTQDLDALHLLDSEGHWSYTVCLTAIGRYLDVKLEAGQRDNMFAYARATMQHYGRWMAAHEKPALSVPEELEYVTEAWAAQDFRKANVLRIAAACTDDAAEEEAMRRKADELNDAAWKDLTGFGDAHLTARCLSILMTEGSRDVFHRTCCPEYVPPAEREHEWDEWEMFVPQKQRVKSMLRNPVGLLRAVGRVMNPRRIRESVHALRRML